MSLELTKNKKLMKNIYTPQSIDLLKAYEIMLTSRLLDEKMLILLKQGKSFFHIGCMGHEAVQVAFAKAMRKNIDFLFPYYRDQAFCLALGQSVYECFLSFLAKADDPHSAGRQMPMHYGNKSLNIPTSSSSTGTQFLQSVGNALAAQRLFAKKETSEYSVTICSCGDGTTSQGEFYEAISWAAKDKAPVVFLVQNNRYAISVEISNQRPGGLIAENFSSFYGLQISKIDGCNLEESFLAAQKALDRARKGLGPTLIEADVVRLLPHSSSDDHNKYRTKQSLQKDLLRDPLEILSKELLNKKLVTPSILTKIHERIKDEIDEAATKAQKAQDPHPDDAIKHVWSEKNTIAVAPVIDKNSSELVMVDAINRALKEEMKKNSKILVFGEDVALGKGGVFSATRGLSDEFGEERCFNSPLAEASIVGVAIGYALQGFVPVVEIQFADYIWTAMMQIRNELCTIRYRSNNDFSSKVIIRVPTGGYIHGGLCHSQNIEATFAHIPGIKIAMPSNALDAYGLLKSAINGDDPVLFLEHKALYRQNFAKSLLPSNDDFSLEFGKASIKLSGSDVCVITYGILVQRALEAASILSSEGISVMVIDLRTIVPYDKELVFDAVANTGKVLILHEDMQFMGFGAEIASSIAENCFMYLDAPIMRLAAKDSPVPYSPVLEDVVLPNMQDIISAIKKLAQF